MIKKYDGMTVNERLFVAKKLMSLTKPSMREIEEKLYQFYRALN